MDGLVGWLTQTLGVGTAAGLAHWVAAQIYKRWEERITFTAWVRAGLSEPTLRIVARNRATEPVFIQELRIVEAVGAGLTFNDDGRAGIFEMIEPGPPFSRTVPRRTWDLPVTMPEGLPRRVTILVIGYQGAPDRLRTWKVKAMTTNG